MAIKRQIFSKIQDCANSLLGRIIVFTGARQVGKTTLTKAYFPQYSYLSIEDPIASKQYKNFTASLWHELYTCAALDEIQKEPQLVESIKATYDQYDDVRYILLGSSQILLLQKIKESLAGRCSIFTLYPLTMPELITQNTNNEIVESKFQQLFTSNTSKNYLPSFILDSKYAVKKAKWDYYLKFGGYPALTNSALTDEQRYDWLANYTRTYLERDVRDLVAIRDLEPYIKLQQMLAINTGQVANITSLSKNVGATTKTVNNYLQYLSLSFQAFILPAWSKNGNKRLVKAPKIHYMDNGVLQAVLQKRGGMTVSEFESFVICEMFKQINNICKQVNFYYLRTHDGKEIDLLIEIQDGYYAFEIKMTEHVSNTDARHLRNLDEILDKPILKAFVLSNDNETKDLGDNILAINATMFLS